jgi:hypothetical protein
MDMVYVPHNPDVGYGTHEVVMADEADAAIRELVEVLHAVWTMEPDSEAELNAQVDRVEQILARYEEDS